MPPWKKGELRKIAGSDDLHVLSSAGTASPTEILFFS